MYTIKNGNHITEKYVDCDVSRGGSGNEIVEVKKMGISVHIVVVSTLLISDYVLPKIFHFHF